MSRVDAWVVGVVGLLLAGPGCAQSHTSSVAGIDGSARMVELTDEQWRALCSWREGLRGDEPARYSCRGAELLSERCTGAPPCWNYNWSEVACYGEPGDDRWGWSRAVPDCRTTVAEWASCLARLEALTCYIAHPQPVECAGIDECRTGRGDRDGGVARDGS